MVGKNVEQEREAEGAVTYTCKLDSPAVYLFILSGEVVVDNDVLKERDGMALDDLSGIEIRANRESTILCIETTVHEKANVEANNPDRVELIARTKA